MELILNIEIIIKEVEYMELSLPKRKVLIKSQHVWTAIDKLGLYEDTINVGLMNKEIDFDKDGNIIGIKDYEA